MEATIPPTSQVFISSYYHISICTNHIIRVGMLATGQIDFIYVFLSF